MPRKDLIKVRRDSAAGWATAEVGGAATEAGELIAVGNDLVISDGVANVADAPRVGSGTYAAKYGGTAVFPDSKNIPENVGVMASPPTITQSTGAVSGLIASPVSRFYTTYPHLFLVTGAALMAHPSAADVWVPGNVTPSDSVNFSGQFLAWKLEFYTDAPVFELQTRRVGGNFRIYVDDKLVSVTPTSQPTGGAIERTVVDFSSVGGRAVRKIGVEGQEMQFKGLSIGAIDSVWPALRRAPLLAVLGDSYVEAGNYATAKYTSFAWRAAQMLGWRIAASGSGGTGYLKTSGVRVKYRDRWRNDLGQLSPDVVVVTGGRNDNGSFSPSNVGAEAALLFADIRSQLPNAKIIAVSPFAASNGETTSLQAFGAAIQSALSGISNSHFLDVLSPALITGTGKVGATTGDGNADVLIGADAVHPTQLGHDVMGRWLAERIASLYSAA